jgi:hypothetical protein
MIIIARVQVAFSRKSAVCLTPNVWLPAAKLAANPPPLEFCTNTTRVRITLAITIRIAMTVYIIYLIF